MTSGIPACIGCGASQSKLFLSGPDRLQEKGGSFTLLQCQQCGTVFLHPAASPQSFEADYPENYQAYAARGVHSTLARKSLEYGLYKQARAITQRVETTGRVLDIGCGEGGFLAALRRKGWLVAGIELNQQIAREAHQEQRIDIIVANALEVPIARRSFDLITLWDVLEHLPDPRQALAETARLAKPGARLVISTPNLESFEARWLGKYWAGWDIPRHVWLFPRAVLIRLLEENGWKVTEVAFMRGRHWLLAQSLRFWLKDHHIALLPDRIIRWAFSSWIIRILLLPYFFLLERLQKGSILVYFAQRREEAHA